MTHLVAILLNPKPGDAETKSERNIATAASVLGVASHEIVNMSLVITKDSPELNERAQVEDVWIKARPVLSEALSSADLVLAAWGQQHYTGKARVTFRGQQLWILGELTQKGFEFVITLDGRPRHPSRWRMYLGPQRGLFVGGAFEDRLAIALRETPISELVG